MPNKPIYVCKQCGTDFQGYPGNPNNFCSRQCYWDSKKKKVTRVCQECGREYRATPTGKKKFCSGTCYHKCQGRNSVDTFCLTCGKPIRKWKSQIYPSGNVFCSRECSVEATRKPGWRKEYFSTPKCRLNERIRGGIRDSIKVGKNGRHWEELVDYTLDDLKRHIEKQFMDGMDWEQFCDGNIHIDHKIPICAFNFETPEHTDFKRCWSLSNIQPLWAKDNLEKSSKLSQPFQPSLF